MNQTWPDEFKQLETQVAGKSDEIVQAFRYSLARLLVEQGRLNDVSDTGDVVYFRTPEGEEFDLPKPHLPDAQAEMVKDHLRWLFQL